MMLVYSGPCMNKDFSELIEYLDGKFNRIDEKFELIDERFEQVESELAGLRGIVLSGQTGLDAYTKKADIYFQEMTFLSRQVDRHENWIEKASSKIGIKFER